VFVTSARSGVPFFVLSIHWENASRNGSVTMNQAINPTPDNICKE
jgi:hypothetical protein